MTIPPFQLGERKKMRLRRFVLGLSIIASVTTLTSLSFAASPAYAYGSLTPRYALVDTDNCARIAGTLTVIAHADSCELPDSADGTFFRKDAGGVAIKVELRDSNGMVAKEEFHPYGEVLWVYDTRNDSDGVYTWLAVLGSWHGPYFPRGTSNTIDYAVYNLSFTEGERVDMHIYDDESATDFIFSIGGGRA